MTVTDTNPRLHNTLSPNIAYFISPHGFGHAARACAVIEGLRWRRPDLRCELFTRVPRWFFQESLGDTFGYHDLLTDIGLVQRNALHADLPATLDRLEELFPLPPTQIEVLAQQVTSLGCDLIICDIAPMGIAVAQAAGLPSVLIENFTWDWIYEPYSSRWPALVRFQEYLHLLFTSTTYHIQTEPVCRPGQSRPVDLTVAPVARRSRMDSAQVRDTLGIPANAATVLVTMGGADWSHTDLRQLAGCATHFIIPGGAAPVGSQPDAPNVHILPRQSGVYHPDLVAASDAVLGKIGYSTLAEVCRAGIPYGYIRRPVFPESATLADYVKEHMTGLPISVAALEDGTWMDIVPALLRLPRYQPPAGNGADEIADFILR